MSLLPIDWTEPATRDFWQGLLIGVGIGTVFGGVVIGCTVAIVFA